MSDGFLRRFLAGQWQPGEAEMHAYLDHLLSTPAPGAGKEVVALLAALSARPLTASSVAHFVSYVRRVSPRRAIAGAERAVNIVGTGGGAATFNVSTTAAFVAAAAGADVLKSGSRARTSASGAMDVLLALGVQLPRDAGEVADMIGDVGIGFVPEGHGAPLLRRLAVSVHPLAWRDVGGFVNTVGPLLSPYETAGQVIGVARPEHVAVFREAIAVLERQRTLLVHSYAGMDELCSVADNFAAWVHRGGPPVDVPIDRRGLAPGELRDLEGGDAARNAAIVRGVLGGTVAGPARDTVALNAGALLLVAGVVSSLPDGLARASEAIDDGAALAILERATVWRAAAERVSA